MIQTPRVDGNFARAPGTTLKSQWSWLRLSKTILTTVAMLAFGFPASTTAVAAEQGRGLTANFEIALMEQIIDHHYSALRMTELAAGTDTRRTGDLSPNEGTSPTPAYPATRSKASMAEVKSNARMENRTQREQILQLEQFLTEWYGVNYQPKVRPEQQPAIGILEHAQSGRTFDHAYLEVFARHHYELFEPLNGCITGADRRHVALVRLCTEMWHAQTAGVDEMRELLEQKFGVVDYQPFDGDRPLRTRPASPRGYHSGGD
ncbi:MULTISPECIES: DUF305 domain-containing protein [unclassified Caballeronia]|uniref:DUF305 domain-containing protein n=1 Tax=unclassified Caballeronia TaxID=2646786 RepID=UPI002865841B|nr:MULTISPECIES: DUF305 domain-containing protein [unclassified Caballeronia]MDR5751314.1 DUF305 domain-containing protein [Caballeronia sp. LZ024]MDR5844544.1 DUF305 domain-containing protein [Caballeronia sp. LZ031]